MCDMIDMITRVY